jgi:hypothetical protein
MIIAIMKLTNTQFKAVRALMPAVVTDAEIRTRTLVSERSNELICLVGMHFAKCAIPAELPTIENTNDLQAYHKAFTVVGYRATMKTLTTRTKNGGYRYEYLCSLRLQGAQEDAYIARRKPDATDKESLKWVNLLMLRDCYEWLSKNY